MKNIALLVGNHFNDLGTGVTWTNLLNKITDFCGVSQQIVFHDKKPFPLLYEEIFLSALQRNGRIEEKALKIFIAEQVAKITQNEIHEAIRALQPAHVMTTNYDYSLQGIAPAKNLGIVNETLYSIFRKNECDRTTYWHLHGESNYPLSINLGYEHYCGQLQNMRNYVVNGTSYQSRLVKKDPLEKRLAEKGSLAIQSWIDLFFTHDVHIFGLGLDFVENDLWWLLTYRARSKFYKNKIQIKNKIYYYIPKDYVSSSQYKLDLFKANNVEIVQLPMPSKLEYYRSVIQYIHEI
ncbi:hypothetical protein EZ456_20835 [Pedobacter psychrodurus]|uniref:SIR2-like domain-containing protein n=1 Tax=Pedobacter psychrodurus TaxID=2530456 RepID=A0A4R0PMY2_9SPHI|nr:hypothetical protein [Pedobacter psychrodurus]TCD18945.1 hypothetical protein EZ456_20835 [Pedobacter psychrodurus]